MTSRLIAHVRERRQQSTTSETLLWSILRARQVCSLRFRREHPVAGFLADFAFEEKRLVVEIDGGYHEQTVKHDVSREAALRTAGWDVLRFTSLDVEEDAEGVARSIASHLGLEYVFRRRTGGGSGMKAD